jgi:hypothetical protein
VYLVYNRVSQQRMKHPIRNTEGMLRALRRLGEIPLTAKSVGISPAFTTVLPPVYAGTSGDFESYPCTILPRCYFSRELLLNFLAKSQSVLPRGKSHLGAYDLFTISQGMPASTPSVRPSERGMVCIFLVCVNHSSYSHASSRQQASKLLSPLTVRGASPYRLPFGL